VSGIKEFFRAKLYIGLVHYPIVSKDGRITQTSVTNLDVHDIARTARTYDLSGYYLIAPAENQLGLLKKIIGHWSEGFGLEYNSDRSEALSLIRISPSISDAVSQIGRETGREVRTVVTDAKIHENNSRNISCISLQNMLKLNDLSFILLFGTGWGLANAAIEKADHILEPIRPLTEHGYNHLSVRAAAAIITDRIVGENSFGPKSGAENISK